jgi:hypothetical protein
MLLEYVPSVQASRLEQHQESSLQDSRSNLTSYFDTSLTDEFKMHG